jgi:DNA polymerase-1
VALMTGMSIDEAKAFIEEFFGTFKVLKQWLERQGLLAVELGYSCSPRGRKRFYTLPADDAEDAKELIAQIKRWAGNMPIQAGNADILKVAMRNIYLAVRGGSFVGKKLYDVRFLLVVHDEIVMVCAEKDIPAVKAIMAKCMNDAYHQIVPKFGEPGWIALGPEKHDWGVEVVEAEIWAKA